MLPQTSRDTPAGQIARIASVDALRGLVMFMMIFVNDLAGAGKVVPDWMVHYSDRHTGGSGMTFVDLVFPAFLFIVGMSIPFALGRRLEKGEAAWRILGHVAVRTASLLFIGILMVHGTPDTQAMGWPGDWWCVLLYLSAIAAFCTLSPRRSAAAGPHSRGYWPLVGRCVRLAGLAALVWLAFAYRGANGQRIITLHPFMLDTRWYGILGLIAWAYLIASIVFLVFRNHRTAILGCMVLLLGLFAADKAGAFEGFWLNRIVGIGGTLGSLPAISVGGVLLGSVLVTSDSPGLKVRSRFTFWFVAGCVAGALLLNRAYGISKNNATPSWCLWACAITAALWYGFYWIADVRPLKISRALVLAGENVLLAYLISDLLPSLLQVLHLAGAYWSLASSLPLAVTRSTVCGILILLVSIGLNRAGFRLRL